jgi:uncharacterized protein YhhL (DUF1145 family)
MRRFALTYLVQDFSEEVNILLSISVALLLLSIALVFFILISRLVKSYHLKKEEKYKHLFREIIYGLSVQEKSYLDDKSDDNLLELKKNIKSVFGQQVLIDELIHIRKNVVGTSADNIYAIYTNLGLHQNSLKKLKSISWVTKARGIRELAEMDYYKAVPEIQQFLTVPQQTIREESILALIRLSKNDSFNFINDYKGEITPWIEINIHKHLLTLDSRKLPNFSLWFQHPNRSVRCFSLKMARLFRQTESLPQLITLLTEADEGVALLAAEAICDMAGEEYAAPLAETLRNTWDYDQISIRLINTLGSIADPQIHSKFITPFLSHPDYEVRLATVRALEQLDGAEQHVHTLEKNTQVAIQHMIAHVNNTLLN